MFFCFGLLGLFFGVVDEDAGAGLVDEVGVSPLKNDEEFGAEADEEGDVYEEPS